MRILFVVHQFFPSFHTGSERLTLDTAKQIQRMGHFVSVLTYEPNPPIEKSNELSEKQKTTKNQEFVKLDQYLMKKEYQYETVPVIAFKYAKHTLGFRIFDPNMEKHMIDVVKNFDIVHFTHPMFFCSALKACKKHGVPTVFTASDTWLLSPRSLVTSNFQLCNGPEEGKKCMRDCYYDKEVLTRYKEAKWFFDNVDRVFASSEFGQRTFHQNGWKRDMEVIHYSRDYTYVKPVGDPKEITFGFIGSLIWHKGPDVLIKAFRKVQNEKIKLKIFGRGDERDPYLKDIREFAKGDNRIEFCGTFDHSELPKLMEQLSVIVVPSSYKDNYPLVTQEAMAYEKPLIGSRNGGIPEVIEDGVNGFLFDPGNVDQLADIITSISENPEKIKELKKGIKPPPRIESEALRYENVYRELLSSPNKEKTQSEILPIRNDYKTKSFGEAKKRILFFSHNLNLEGATRWVYFLSLELKKFGYDITVVSPIDGDLREYYKKEKIDIFVDPIFQNNSEIDQEFLKKFDLVFLNTIVNSIFVQTLKKIGIPAIMLIHESDRDVYMSEGIQESPFKLADRVVFSAEATRGVYSDLETNKNFRTIPTALDFDAIELFKSKNNKIDIRNKHGFNTDDKIVTIVGTIIPRKGQLHFVEAAINLLNKNSENLHFVMVGAIETDYMREIREKIKHSKHQDHIHEFPVSEPFDFFMMSDIFVCTSFVESFPNVIMEAMAFELPIVSSDVFGIPEQIQDGTHGLLVKPGNSKVLGEKIEFLLNHPELAKKYAERSYERIKSEITMKRAIKSYDSLIKEIISRKISLS